MAAATAEQGAGGGGPDRRAPQLFVAEDGEEEGTLRAPHWAVPPRAPANAQATRRPWTPQGSAAGRGRKARPRTPEEVVGAGRRAPLRASIAPPLLELRCGRRTMDPRRALLFGRPATAARKMELPRRVRRRTATAGGGGRPRKQRWGGRGRPRAQGTGKAGRPGASPVPWRLACLEEEERRKRRERRMTRGTH